MNKKVLIILLVITLPITVLGQNITNFFTAYTCEAITVDDTVGGKGFTLSKISPSTYSRAQLAIFRVECVSTSPCPIRFTVDGTTVSTMFGMILNEGDTISLYNYNNIRLFKAIRSGSNSAIIQPTYYR